MRNEAIRATAKAYETPRLITIGRLGDGLEWWASLGGMETVSYHEPDVSARELRSAR